MVKQNWQECNFLSHYLPGDRIIRRTGGWVRGAAALIRANLHLSYVQVGMLLTIPNTIASFIEPILGIWADIGQRRQLIWVVVWRLRSPCC